jgi:hypothetical protein
MGFILTWGKARNMQIAKKDQGVQRHNKRTMPRLWLTISALLSLMLLAACNDGSDNGGINLGSGPLLAFIGGDGNLWLAKGDGSAAHAVTVANCLAGRACYGPPTWSPDGQSVAVFGPDASTPTNNDIFVFNRQGLLQQTIHPVSPLAFGRVLWSSDSKQVAYVGTPDSVTDPTNKAPRFALVLLVVSSGAKSGAIILPSPGSAQCASNPRGGPLGSLVERAVNGSTGQGLRDTLDWSTDGQHVAINAGNCGTETQVVDRNGNAQVLNPVNGATANIVQGLFSPDGKQLVATQTNSAQDDLLIYSADGSGGKSIYSDKDTPPTFAPRLGSPRWTADGKSIYFSRGESLWVINADGTNPHQLVAGVATGDPLKSEAAPLPSPDGQHLVWNELTLSASDNTPRSTLLCGDANGGNPKVVADGAYWPSYSAK